MILIDTDLNLALTSASDKAMRSAAPAAQGFPRTQRLPSVRTLARFLTQAQSAVRLKGEVTVLLTRDAYLRRLNRQFRGKNQATDVLSFPAEGSFPAAGIGAEKIAGDLAISAPTALKQAVEQGHSLSAEIKILILHGLLHLAGYDHESDNGKMARREVLLRAKLNLPQGLIERAEVNPAVKSPTNAPCPIPSRSLQKGGKPRTSTRRRGATS